jgi:hypothetical protein
MQPIDEKDQRIKHLENENRFLLEEIKRLEHNVEALTQAVLQASKQRFGASSEKTPATYGQMSLFGEEADNLALPYASVINIKEHQRPIRKKGDREKLTLGLARETVECVLNPEEFACEMCGSELKVIGKKKVRSEMEYIPAKLVMKDYIQYVYKCMECGKNDENPYDAIYSAPVPAPVLMTPSPHPPVLPGSCIRNICSPYLCTGRKKIFKGWERP